MGGLESESAPPAITMSASPVRIAWVPLTIACVLVAQARLTEYESTEAGKLPRIATSRAMFGPAMSATTAPKTI